MKFDVCSLWLQGSDGLCWKDLLRIKSPHKLLYALEIIEALGKPNRRIHRESTVHVQNHTHTCSPADLQMSRLLKHVCVCISGQLQ